MIFLILILAFLLRIINLGQSLWLDEAITAQAVKNNSLVELITRFAPGDFHPPLYYLLLKFWTNAFGYSEISLRFPSVVFGAVTIYFVYLIGKKLFEKKVGLIAALFLAVNPLAVYYSQEARMYSLASLLITASVLLMIHKKWFWFVLTLSLALYTDYMPYLMLPVFLLFSRATVAVGFFLLPWLPILFGQMTAGIEISSSWGDILGRTSLKNLFLVPVKFIFGRISFDNKILYGIIVVPIVAVYSYFLAKSREKFLWCWFSIPLLLAALVSFKLPVFSYFRLLFVLPAFVLLFAGGVTNRWLVSFVVIVSLTSLTYFNLSPKFQREDWRGLVRTVENNPGYMLMPNLAQSAPIVYYGGNLEIADVNSYNLAGKQTVYLLRYVQEVFDPADKLRTELIRNEFNKTSEQSFNGIVVWKYSK